MRLLKDIFSKEEGALISSGDVIAFKSTRRNALKFVNYIMAGNYAQIYSLATKAKSIYVDPSTLPLIETPSQLLELNRKILMEDLRSLSRLYGNRRLSGKCIKVLGRKDNLLTEAGVVVNDYVLFNTSKGPIFIGEGAELGPMTYVEGPAYIGRNTRIFVWEQSECRFIGPNSRIEGIVDSSVLLGNAKTGGNMTIRRAYVGESVLVGSNVSIGDSIGLRGVGTGGDGLDRTMGGVSIVGDFAVLYPGTAVEGSVRVGVGAQVHGSVQSDIPSFTVYSPMLQGEIRDIGVEGSIVNVRRVAGLLGTGIDSRDLDFIVRHVY